MKGSIRSFTGYVRALGPWSILAACALALGCSALLNRGAAPEGSIEVSACGDVMIQNVDAGRPLGDAQLMGFMKAAEPWFRAAHVAVANLEGPIGGSEPKPCSSANCWRFNQGPLTARALSESGVKVVSLANNHANDMGRSGQASTLRALDAAGLRSAGLFERPTTRWEAAGRTVELVSMTANRFAPDFRGAGALEAVRSAKARSSLVILALHMGCEGEACARIKGGPEIYLGEDRGDPVAFSRAAIDAGADLVLGHGPHVPRGLGLWRGKLIAYSLGNCAAGPGISTAGKAGWAPVLWARLGADGRAQAWDVGSFAGDGRSMAWDAKERALGWMLRATELDAEPAEAAKIMALRVRRDDLRPAR